MPTVTTGAVESGATTTCSPFASLVLSIPIWSRFTRCPLSLLLLVSVPQNSFPARPTSRRDLGKAHERLADSASHKPAQIPAANSEVHSNGRVRFCNPRERAGRSTPCEAPTSQNSPAPGGSKAIARARLRCASFPARQAIGWQLLPPQEHDQRPSLPRRGTGVFYCRQCAQANRRAPWQSAGLLAPPGFRLRW